VTPADFDADGDVDLAVGSTVSANSASVNVLLNNGAGAFGAPATYGASTRAWQVESGDVDGDGDVDLVVWSLLGVPGLGFLPNLGNGTFGPIAPITAGGAVRSATLLDVDADGDPDLALGLDNQPVLRILQNQGGGVFTASSYAAGSYAFASTSADFDGDGDIDVATAGLGVSVHFNQGNGTFQPDVRYVVPAGMAITSADLESDGDVDLAVTSSLGVTVMRNQGGGVFQAERPRPLEYGIHYWITALDVEGNGLPDLVVGSGGNSYGQVEYGGNLEVMLNPGAGRLPRPPFQVGRLMTALASPDLDGDGDLDLVLANPLEDRVVVYANLGNGSFTPPASYAAGSGPFEVTTGDFDADGDVDLATANPANPGPSTACVLLNLGAGTFAPAVSYPINPHDGRSIESGDIDGDGDLDLVVGHPTSFSFLLNQGNGTFALGGALSSGQGGEDFELADLDGDGDLDLARNGTFVGSVDVHSNNGAGSFAPYVRYVTGAGSHGVVVADLDADGDPDIAATNYDVGTVSVLVNQGAGNFLVAFPIAVGRAPVAITTADPDADGDLDLLVTNEASNDVSLLLNQGGAGFSAGGTFAVRSRPRQSITGDFDADGDLDVVVVNYDSPYLSIVRNCSSAGTTFCAGDGSVAPCPCGNQGPTGAQAGCLSSLGVGGALRASGLANLQQDSVVLTATQTPSTLAIFFQGTSASSATPLGDGLLCVGGTLIRLGSSIAAGGVSQYPATGQAPIHQRGAITGGGTRVYQVWYRNAAGFCTPSTYNLTNAVQLTWTP
jgi:hypothetical protein